MKEVSIQFFGFQEYNTVMHELEITQHILADSIREAERHGAKAIREIRLAIGPFSGFVPECIQMYMDVLDDRAGGAHQDADHPASRPLPRLRENFADRSDTYRMSALPWPEPETAVWK